MKASAAFKRYKEAITNPQIPPEEVFRRWVNGVARFFGLPPSVIESSVAGRNFRRFVERGMGPEPGTDQLAGIPTGPTTDDLQVDITPDDIVRCSVQPGFLEIDQVFSDTRAAFGFLEQIVAESARLPVPDMSRRFDEARELFEDIAGFADFTGALRGSGVEPVEFRQMAADVEKIRSEVKRSGGLIGADLKATRDLIAATGRRLDKFNRARANQMFECLIR